MSERDEGSKMASEEELGDKWDRCVADTLLKTGTGLGLGVVFSLLLFKRRPWPVTLGAGFGMGYALSNCQHDFRRVASVHLAPVRGEGSMPPTEHSSPPEQSSLDSQTTSEKPDESQT